MFGPVGQAPGRGRRVPRLLNLLQLRLGLWLSRTAIERIERHADRKAVR